MYAPLLFRYARARGLSRDDAEEVRDQCLEIVSRKMESFAYSKTKGGFKAWLSTIVKRKVIDMARRHRENIADTQELRALRDPGPTPDEAWERAWRNEHLRYCVELVRPMVSEINFRAFGMLMLDECSVAEVTAELGLNSNQIYKAKSRVLKCVREKMAELGLDQDG